MTADVQLGRLRPTRFTWRAGADRIAHATWRDGSRHERTACGVPAVLERLAWPERSWCGPCRDALGLGWLDEP